MAFTDIDLFSREARIFQENGFSYKRKVDCKQEGAVNKSECTQRGETEARRKNREETREEVGMRPSEFMSPLQSESKGPFPQRKNSFRTDLKSG